MKKRKILFVFNSIYLPLDWTGGSICLHEIVIALHNKGHDVRVISARGSAITPLQLLHRAKGIIQPSKRHLTMDTFNGYPCYRTWEFKKALADLSVQWNPDAIITAAGPISEIESIIPNTFTGVVGAYIQSERRMLHEEFSPKKKYVYAVTSEYMMSRFLELHGESPSGIIFPPTNPSSVTSLTNI